MIFDKKNYIRGCEDHTELKFHKIFLYFKHNLEKIGRFKISTRSGQQKASKGPEKSWIMTPSENR